MVAHMKLQEPAMVMTVGSHVPLPPPEPTPMQIISTTFEAEGIYLGPLQLKDLKAPTTK